jgi:DNA-binding response OmpR family regulator
MARVLVAEDEPDLQYAIRSKLTAAGYEVTVVADGRVALLEAMAAPPELYILDVSTPGLTGIELCRILRNDPSTATVPIVMLTARVHVADIERCLARGADYYIVKPFRLGDLTDRVGDLLDCARQPAGALARR